MKKVCTLILNRNLPKVTDSLYEHLEKFDGDQTDIFVVEAGSDNGNLSRYVTWHDDSDDARRNGLRYCRGMNFGLTQLIKERKFFNYDAFFLLTNDTEFRPAPTLLPLMRILNDHPSVGILSPCSERWGEKHLFKDLNIKYFWFIHNNALLLRREFIECICDIKEASTISFLFDGNNFRGYGTEHELIAKGYANDWAAAITNDVWSSENERYLLDEADNIKTEKYDDNLRLYISEGKKWMKDKYGFNSHWTMQQYVKSFYDKFFEYHPEYKMYKL